ncbi:MAG: pglI [Sphingobacteriales bacterium]|nr:pglI [Sphingobacteriales bacterium]
MDLIKYIPDYKPVVDFKAEFQFTVFVPVFNRADTIHRVFESLNSQTFRDFEVIVINDGSTDNSHVVIHELLKTYDFKAIYIDNEVNRHKLACRMQAIKLAKGEFFIALDSDDACTPDALKVFYEEYTNIPEDMKPKVSGVSCCCVNQYGALVGDYFPQDPFFNNSFDKKVYYNIQGEKWGFNKTSVLKGVCINEEIYAKGLIPESLIWFLIAREGYTTKYINKTLRIYYLDSNDGLSKIGYNKKALGMAIFALSTINWFHIKHFKKATNFFLMRLLSLLKASRYLDFGLKDYVAAINNYVLKSLFIALWPFRRVL